MSRIRSSKTTDKTNDNGQLIQPVTGDAHEPDAGADTSFEPPQTESSPPASADQVINPYDPATYKVPQSLAAAAGVEKHLVELPVRAPDKTWWVRRHPEEEYSRKSYFIILKEEQEVYLVLPHLWKHLVGEPTFKPMRLYLSVTMQGKLFLWSVKIPADETKEPAKWMRAPLDAVRRAKDKWTHIYWNEETRQHDVETGDSEVQPQWPDRPMPELMELAFKGFVIDSLDHPVIRRLRGKTP
jgi:hypothetical protein